MKTTRFIWVALAAATFATAARAGETVTNRLTASLRFGLNISARFTGSSASLGAFGVTRTTPRGDTYNYDDGYVLTDVSGNEGDQTWYWGYDNSATHPAGQISDGVAFPANTILFSRSTPNGTFTSPSMDHDPQPGVEVTYDRHLGTTHGVNYGVEVAGNFMAIFLRDNRPYSGTVTRTTDAYPFTPGTTPPGATPGDPYQGSYDGFGFLLGATPVPGASTTAIVPGGFTISGTRKLAADLWGMRLGPYLDAPLGTNWNLWISGGVAVGLLSAEATWSETITLPGPTSLPSAGRGRDHDLLWGWYVSANLSWDFNDRWSAVVGVQFQDLGKYRHDFGGRTAELDLSESIFVTIGLSRRF
ncbi:MAG: hypothetical protein EXS35_04535 [Pedosphaera sp.]|nr:hypothetical protein [Pedosphaera sp.]